jgi:hypothetical protein
MNYRILPTDYDRYVCEQRQAKYQSASVGIS